MNYKITLSEEQLRLIAYDLELASRLRCGQLSELNNLFFERNFDNERVSALLDQLKDEVFPELQGCYYGIYESKTPTKSKSEYDMYKQIQYEFNKNSKYRNVHSEPFVMFASEDGNIVIEKEKAE